MAIVMGLFPTVFLAPTAPAIDKLVARMGQVQQVNVEAPAAAPVQESAGSLRSPNRQSSPPPLVELGRGLAGALRAKAEVVNRQ
jgi:hypothetical protein